MISKTSPDFNALHRVLKGYIPEKQTEQLYLEEDHSTDGTQYLGLQTQYDGTYKQYYVLDQAKLRKKFIQLTFTTLITQTLTALPVIIYDLFYAVTFNCCRSFTSLSQRILATGFLLLHILSIPFAIVGMFCIAIYGIACPKSARAPYAKLEGWVHIRTGLYDVSVCCKRKPFFSALMLPLYPAPVIQQYVDHQKSLRQDYAMR
jgi:hypothetical protein